MKARRREHHCLCTRSGVWVEDIVTFLDDELGLAGQQLLLVDAAERRSKRKQTATPRRRRQRRMSDHGALRRDLQWPLTLPGARGGVLDVGVPPADRRYLPVVEVSAGTAWLVVEMRNVLHITERAPAKS